MQRRFPVGWAIFGFAVVMVAIGYQMYFARPSVNSSNPLDVDRMNAVAALSACKSDLRLRLLIQYEKPPIYQEEYRMRDANGISTYSYRIRAYAGKQVTVTAEPGEVFDVSFFFGSVVEDGVWNLTDRAPRNATDPRYTLDVQQTALIHVDDSNGGTGRTACRTGKRAITFTNPQYWATTAGRQFHLDLRKGAPKNASDLLRMQSSALADPRFEKIVEDFRGFGPPSFRTKVASARASILRPQRSR